MEKLHAAPLLEMHETYRALVSGTEQCSICQLLIRPDSKTCKVADFHLGCEQHLQNGSVINMQLRLSSVRINMHLCLISDGTGMFSKLQCNAC